MYVFITKQINTEKPNKFSEFFISTESLYFKIQ